MVGRVYFQSFACGFPLGVTVHMEASLCLCWASGRLAGAVCTVCEASCYLWTLESVTQAEGSHPSCGVCGPLGESAASAEKGLYCGGATGRDSGLAQPLGWGSASGHHQGRVDGVRSVERRDLVPASAAWGVGGEHPRGTVVPASSSFPRESCPQSLHLQPSSQRQLI